MVNTVTIKQGQMQRGFAQFGSGNIHVVLIGSCRSVPYVNYILELNKIRGEMFTIYALDPFNWNWDAADNRVDCEAAINKQENNNELLCVLKKSTIFIHEYYRNFGMFNTFKESEKNIYQYGINPDIDICLPNFHDVFLLFNDIIRFTPALKAQAIQDFAANGSLGSETIKAVTEMHDANLARFYGVCEKTSFPVFAEYFKLHHLSKRMYWTYNHVGNEFTHPLFNGICEKLGIKLTPVEERRIHALPDIFANNYTKITNYDVNYFGYKWNEKVERLNPKEL